MHADTFTVSLEAKRKSHLRGVIKYVDTYIQDTHALDFIFTY